MDYFSDGAVISADLGPQFKAVIAKDFQLEIYRRKSTIAFRLSSATTVDEHSDYLQHL